MSRGLSRVAPGWWDYTTLPEDLLAEAARLDARDMASLSRPGFRVLFYDSLEEFYLAEALKCIEAWRQATPDRPAGICGPIGPTEQLPLVARMVNSLGVSLRDAHFWGMDEWVEEGKAVGREHPPSFASADMRLCFNRIEPELSMPEENLHFPTGDPGEYSKSFDRARCVIMQGGQGEARHWAFNDPPRREGEYEESPPLPSEYLELGARIVELHPMTIMQNARTSGGGNASVVPTHAATVGPVETWKAETVSIWHAGTHDNPFGMRMTTLMVSRGVTDTSVPISLLAEHPDVRFNFYRKALGRVDAELH